MSGDSAAESDPLPREGAEDGRRNLPADPEWPRREGAEDGRPDGRADGVRERGHGASRSRAEASRIGDGAGEAPHVSITLSRSQVDRVVRAALGADADPSMSTLLDGTGFHRSHAREALGVRYRALKDNRRLSRSLLSGLLVLSCFPRDGVDLGIKDISKELKLNTSTVHRYVLTLVAAGLLERDPDTRRYRLLAQ